MADGYEWRERRSMEMLAWHAVNVMQPHVKKRLRPSMLLGSKQFVPGSLEEFRWAWQKARKQEVG